MERFAQFVSQLLLSALTEVMPDTTNTATVCVCKHAQNMRISVCASTKSMEGNICDWKQEHIM